MWIRKTRRPDFNRIDEIYRKYHEDKFALPDLNSTLTHAVVLNEDKIIGFGVVKFYAEAIAILDLHESKVDRIEALTMLLTEAFRACEEHGISQLHVYVQDKGMQKLLENKFDFKVATGVALVKEFANGERRDEKDEQDA